MRKLYTLIAIAIIFSNCKNQGGSHAVSVQKWKVLDMHVLDTANSRFLPYFLKRTSTGQNGVLELHDNGEKGQTLKVYDGTGRLLIESVIGDVDRYKGGFHSQTTFFDKPNRQSTYQKNVGVVTPENIVLDKITKVDGTVRFVPYLFGGVDKTLSAVQFDNPLNKESISIKLFPKLVQEESD